MSRAADVVRERLHRLRPGPVHRLVDDLLDAMDSDEFDEGAKPRGGRGVVRIDMALEEIQRATQGGA